jgi:hypothetical protein
VRITGNQSDGQEYSQGGRQAENLLYTQALKRFKSIFTEQKVAVSSPDQVDFFLN